MKKYDNTQDYRNLSKTTTTLSKASQRIENKIKLQDFFEITGQYGFLLDYLEDINFSSMTLWDLQNPKHRKTLISSLNNFKTLISNSVVIPIDDRYELFTPTHSEYCVDYKYWNIIEDILSYLEDRDPEFLRFNINEDTLSVYEYIEGHFENISNLLLEIEEKKGQMTFNIIKTIVNQMIIGHNIITAILNSTPLLLEEINKFSLSVNGQSIQDRIEVLFENVGLM
jgi:hypothetical protein